MKTARLATRISNGYNRLWAALKSHPVEFLILLHATLSSCLDGSPLWQQPSYYAAFAFVAAFSISRFRGCKAWASWLYFAILPLYALTAFLPEAWPKSYEFILLNFLLPAIYLLTPSSPTRTAGLFSERFFRLMRSCIIALGIATILFILFLFIDLTIELLFSVNTHSSENYLLCICYIFVAPMLFISLESQEEQPKVIRLVEVIINYVLTPVLLLYNLILYVYLVTILLNWELPKNSVSTMVMVFTLIAVAIRLVRPLLAKQPLQWYFRWFSLFATPLVVLFWVAVGYRIGQYGITIDRCILFVAGALMTLYLIGSLIFDSRLSTFNYRFTALIVLCGVVLAIGGPLSARQISLRSQTAIVREKAMALGILTDNGKLDTSQKLFFRSEADTVSRKDHRAAYQAMKYIEKDLSDTNTLRATLGMTSAEYLDHLSHKTSSYATAWLAEDNFGRDDPITPRAYYFLSCYDEEEIDLSGYTRMVVEPNNVLKDNTIHYPGGQINADTLLATQLAKIGYALDSNLEREKMDDNECKLCHYQSPDGKVLILFKRLEIERTDSLNHITDACIHCALVQ